MKYKYFKKYEADEINLEVLDELEKYVKVKKRLFFSMIFWSTFNILALRYIMNCFYTHSILKFAVYSIFILPNVWFYIRKFKANRIEMQKILILNNLRKQKIFYYLENNFYEAPYTKEDYSIINSIANTNENSNNTINLESQNELEKFLEDYYNNAIYGNFFNLKF